MHTLYICLQSGKRGLCGCPPSPPPPPPPQNIIRENPFTDTLRTGSESPFSIGEGIDGPEKMISNPFLSEPLGGAGQDGQQPLSMWEMQRQQVREGGSE